MSTQNPPRLTRAEFTRSGHDVTPPPVRIVHLGAGAFHRAHQAWFTAHSTDAAQWGIAAFTGRRDTVARQLAPQGGLFTLIERGPAGDRFEVIPTISEVHPASDPARFTALMTASATAVVTLTVTEAGYHQRPDGELDLEHPAIRHDMRALREGRSASVRTPTGRLLAGLSARTRAGAPPVTVVPCDNVPANGERLRAAIHTLARHAGQEGALANTAFVTTSVDRITPHTTEDDRRAVAEATGWRDEGVVVAEPFADWTLCGDFAGDRPAWESAGARFVADIEPYEQRKLLLLNGGHLVLAFGGLMRGHATVAEAMADPRCRREIDAFWDEAARTAGSVDTRDYRAALVRRFENRRIEHRLSQIAVDTVTKIRMRVLPVLTSERAEGRSGAAALAVVRTWADGIRCGQIEDETDAAAAVARLIDGSAPALAPELVATATLH